MKHGGGAAKRSKRVTDVLPTHEVLDQLAGRIEQAYALRRPRWLRGCSTSRVWYTASLRFGKRTRAIPGGFRWIPSCSWRAQPISTPFSDPWTELAHPRVRPAIPVVRTPDHPAIEGRAQAGSRQGAERLIRQGEEIGDFLSRTTRGLSSLGAYLVARRAGRDDLAEHFAIRRGRPASVVSPVPPGQPGTHPGRILSGRRPPSRTRSQCPLPFASRARVLPSREVQGMRQLTASRGNGPERSDPLMHPISV